MKNANQLLHSENETAVKQARSAFKKFLEKLCLKSLRMLDCKASLNNTTFRT